MINATDFLNEADYWDAVHEEAMGYQGDARRCPVHPHVATSSPDGMFDAPCGACEAEADEAYYREVHEARMASDSDYRARIEALDAEIALQREADAAARAALTLSGDAHDDIPF